MENSLSRLKVWGILFLVFGLLVGGYYFKSKKRGAKDQLPKTFSGQPLFHPDEVTEVSYRAGSKVSYRFVKAPEGWGAVEAARIHRHLSVLAESSYQEKAGEEHLPSAETSLVELGITAQGAHWTAVWNGINFIWIDGPAKRKFLEDLPGEFVATLSSGKFLFQKTELNLCPQRIISFAFSEIGKNQVLEFGKKGWVMSGEPLGPAGSTAVERWLDKNCHVETGILVDPSLVPSAKWKFSETLKIRHEKSKKDVLFEMDPVSAGVHANTLISYDPGFIQSVHELFSLK